MLFDASYLSSGKNLYQVLAYLDAFLRDGHDIDETSLINLSVYISNSDTLINLPSPLIKRLIDKLIALEQEGMNGLDAILSFLYMKQGDIDFITLNLQDSLNRYRKGLKLLGYNGLPLFDANTPNKNLELIRDAFIKGFYNKLYPVDLIRRIEAISKRLIYMQETRYGTTNALLIDREIEDCAFCLPFSIQLEGDEIKPYSYLIDNATGLDKEEIERLSNRARRLTEQALKDKGFRFDKYSDASYRLCLRPLQPNISGTSLGFSLAACFLSMLSKMGEGDHSLRIYGDMAGSAMLYEDGSFGQVTGYKEKIRAAIESGVTSIVFPSDAESQIEGLYLFINQEFPNMTPFINIYFASGIWDLLDNDIVFEKTIKQRREKRRSRSFYIPCLLGLGLSAASLYLVDMIDIGIERQTPQVQLRENGITAIQEDGRAYNIEVPASLLDLNKVVQVPSAWSQYPGYIFLQEGRLKLWQPEKSRVITYSPSFRKGLKALEFIDMRVLTFNKNSYLAISTHSDDRYMLYLYCASLENPFYLISKYPFLDMKFIQSHVLDYYYDRLIIAQNPAVADNEGREGLDSLIISSFRILPLKNEPVFIDIDKIKYKREAIFYFMYMYGRVAFCFNKGNNSMHDIGLRMRDYRVNESDNLPDMLNIDILLRGEPSLSFNLALVQPYYLYPQLSNTFDFTNPKNIVNHNNMLDAWSIRYYTLREDEKSIRVNIKNEKTIP